MRQKINGRIHVAIQNILREVLVHFPNLPLMFLVSLLLKEKAHTLTISQTQENDVAKLSGRSGDSVFVFLMERPAFCSQLSLLQPLCSPDALTSTKIKGTFAPGKFVSWLT